MQMGMDLEQVAQVTGLVIAQVVTTSKSTTPTAIINLPQPLVLEASFPGLLV